MKNTRMQSTSKLAMMLAIFPLQYLNPNSTQPKTWKWASVWKESVPSGQVSQNAQRKNRNFLIFFLSSIFNFPCSLVPQTPSNPVATTATEKADARNSEGGKSSPPIKGTMLFFPLTSPAAWPDGGTVVGSTQRSGIKESSKFLAK